MKISFNDKNIYPYTLRHGDNKAKYANNQQAEEQSFAGLEQSAERFANYLVSKKGTQNILMSKKFNTFLKTAIENPGLYEALIALLITCTARPLTILGTPGAKMEDKQYASAQSIASGVSGVAFAYAAFDPIKKAIDNVLIDVNGNNVKSAFQQFYNNPENADLISKLAQRNIIPDAQTFAQEVQKNGNIFGYLKDYIKKHGGDEYLAKLFAGDNVAEKQTWMNLAEEYSKKISTIFERVKHTNIPERKTYLVHKSLEFLKEGSYKLSPSAGATRTQFLINYISKIVLFPLTAGITIWAIPKIMKIFFPNHKKNKARGAKAAQANTNPTINNSQPQAKQTLAAKTSSISSGKTNPVFSKFNSAQTKQVSFSGGFSSALSLPKTIYEKGYKNPLSYILGKFFGKIAETKYFSNRVNNLTSNAEITKYGIKVFDRDRKSGKILSKWDNDFFASNLPQIAALFGSCLYIYNTIQNKEIDPERKPTLCTNMAVVAIFSLVAGKFIDKIATPIFDTLKTTHARLMNNKLNYDLESAWKYARSLLTTTFAFRYLGPVLATPTADKLVRLFNRHQAKKAAKN